MSHVLTYYYDRFVPLGLIQNLKIYVFAISASALYPCCIFLLNGTKQTDTKNKDVYERFDVLYIE